MTISETIELLDNLKPNQYPRTRKVKWLSNLDGMIFREIMCTHEGTAIADFTGYDDVTADVELLVPYPYDEEVYINFLQAQIDRENGEMGKYNQSITLYNSAYKLFQDHYNRTHIPIPASTRFVF